MTVCTPIQNGIPYVKWINYIFGDCVYGTQATVSLLLGYASILFWLNAQLPQLIQNYKSGSAEGLSLKFLTIWLAGDSANLIGSILTHQLPFQLYLGVYFVSIDICLLCQYYYYNSYKHHQEDYIIIQPEVQQEQNKLKHENSTLFQHPAEIPINTHSKQVTIDELTPFSSSASPSKWYTLIDNNNIKDNKIQKFMSVFLFTTFYFTNPASTLTTTDIEISEYSVMLSDDTIIWLGRFFAWTCTTLYLMSRVPQLLKNRRRQSVEGLSASLFIFAVCGNFTYASSILTHPGQTIASLTEALPYLIGSAGTLIFDFSIFCQFLYYNNRNKLIQDMV